MSYRLVALDLDGTILRDDLSISARVHDVLAQAQAKGVHLCLASGRGFPNMVRWAETLHITTPVICYQGAVIGDPVTRERLYQSTFPLDLVDELAAFARQRRLSLTLYADDLIYVEDKQHSDAFYERWFGLPYRLVPDLVTALPSPPNKLIIVGEPEVLDAARRPMEDQFGGRLQIVRSHAFFLEGLELGVTKATALAQVAARLGVSREETLAIGDSGNDVAMIAWAGLGVAMGNASDEARAVADVLAPHVDHDGAAEIIVRYCLNGSEA